MKSKFMLLLSAVFLFTFVNLVSGAWTTVTCTLDTPTSDPNINEGENFLMQVTTRATGSGGGYTNIALTGRYCIGLACSPTTTIPTSDGLSTASTNPQTCGAACKNANVQFSWTIDGNTGDDYVIDGRCNGNNDLNTANQAVTVNAGTPDTTPPTFNNTAHNNTEVSQATLFSILWNDETALHPNGQYIFSTNNTGNWVNDSAVNFTTTSSWANVTKVLNDTVGIVIGYRWYATDNAGNSNATGIFTLTTTEPPPAQECIFKGTVKDGSGAAIDGAFVLIVNQSDNIAYFNTTTNSTGDWNVTVEFEDTYTVLAYNGTISYGGDIKPHIVCTFP